MIIAHVGRPAPARLKLVRARVFEFTFRSTSKLEAKVPVVFHILFAGVFHAIVLSHKSLAFPAYETEVATA